jgi:hypothetical protein
MLHGLYKRTRAVQGWKAITLIKRGRHSPDCCRISGRSWVLLSGHDRNSSGFGRSYTISIHDIVAAVVGASRLRCLVTVGFWCSVSCRTVPGHYGSGRQPDLSSGENIVPSAVIDQFEVPYCGCCGECPSAQISCDSEILLLHRLCNSTRPIPERKGITFMKRGGHSPDGCRGCGRSWVLFSMQETKPSCFESS